MPFNWFPVLKAAIAAGDADATVAAAAAHGGVARGDGDGWTPLHWAAMKGKLAVVNGLLAAGAPPEAQDRGGYTVAHRAACYGHADILTALIRSGAAVDDTGGRGVTPLEIAATYGRVRAAAELLAAGAERGLRGDDWDKYNNGEGSWEDAVALSRTLPDPRPTTKFLMFAKKQLRDPRQTLVDAGVPQGATLELGDKPVRGYPAPAAEGPHQLYVKSQSGKSVCVEVELGATVGGVASLAAQYLRPQATLFVGAHVTVTAGFRSDSVPSRTFLRAGLQGTVQLVDEDGDASIVFDGLPARQWVLQRHFGHLTFAHKVEQADAEQRAARVVKGGAADACSRRAASTAPPGSGELTSELTRLFVLYKAGALSPAQFTGAKANLL